MKTILLLRASVPHGALGRTSNIRCTPWTTYRLSSSATVAASRLSRLHAEAEPIRQRHC